MKSIDPIKLQATDVGTVKSYNHETGKGLIARDGNEDVHVNHAALKHESVQSLKAGDRVRFQVIEGPKGWFASAVLMLPATDQVTKAAADTA